MISFIIPTRNEPFVGEVIKSIKKEFRDREIEIIVVDKSTDDTPKIAEQNGAKVIFQVGKGYGDAYLLGFKEARGDILCMIDGDGTYSAKDLKKLVSYVERGECDICLGNRFANLKKEAMPLNRRLGNFLLTALLRRLYNIDIHDSQSGLRAIKKEALDNMFLFSKGMELASEMLIEASKQNLRIKEVPISYNERRGGRSSNGIIYGIKIAGTTVKLLRDYNPLLIFGGAGIIFIVLGSFFGFVVIYDFLATGVLHYIGRALLSFMLFTFGFLAIMLGLILENLNDIDKKFYRIVQIIKGKK